MTCRRARPCRTRRASTSTGDRGRQGRRVRADAGRSERKAVLDWFGRQDAGALHISVVTEAELRRGVAILPEGRRSDALADAIDAMVAEDCADRVLAFNGPAAAIFAGRRAIGRPIGFPDCQIAATARARGAAVATRDVEGCGIDVVNPLDETEDG